MYNTQGCYLGPENWDFSPASRNGSPSHFSRNTMFHFNNTRCQIPGYFPQGEKNIVWKAMAVICVTLKTRKSIIDNHSEKIVKLKNVAALSNVA